MYFVPLQVRRAPAKYIMKTDDDTFVRVDSVLMEAKKIPENKSLYIGNMNYYHKPMRSGKWSVTYEVLLQPFYFSICIVDFLRFICWHTAYMPMVNAIAI